MWPFRRRGPAPEGTGGPVPVARAARRADWPALPPVQRVLANPPAVVETSSFEARLPTRQNPAFLAPLTHQVSPAAPVGSADLARPVTGSRGAELPLRQPPRPSPSRVAQRAVSAAVTPPHPTLVSAPQVASPPLELPSLPSASSAEECYPQAGSDAPAPAPPSPSSAAPADAPPSSEVPTLGARPDDPAPAAEQADPTTAAATQPHVWRSRPGGVGLPLRGVPGSVQRTTTSGRSSAAPGQRGRALPPASGSATPSPATGSAPLASSGAPAGTPSPAESAPPISSEDTGPADPPPWPQQPALGPDMPAAPLVGDRPLQRLTPDSAGGPPPVQLSPRGDLDWPLPELLPGPGASPFAPVPTTSSRPLLGSAPRHVPGSGIAGRGKPSAVFPPRPTGTSAPVVARAMVPEPGQPVKLMRSPVSQPAMQAVRPVRGKPFVPAPTMPTAQRAPAAQIPDPGVAAIAAGVASRDTDGSVVFRSLLDDAMSSGREAASSAASSAIGDARSTATDAASHALSSASDTATGAVTHAASDSPRPPACPRRRRPDQPDQQLPARPPETSTTWPASSTTVCATD